MNYVFLHENESQMTLSSSIVFTWHQYGGRVITLCAFDITDEPCNHTLSNGFSQTQLAEEIDKLRSELDQFRLRAGSLTEPTLSRYVHQGFTLTRLQIAGPWRICSELWVYEIDWLGHPWWHVCRAFCCIHNDNRVEITSSNTLFLLFSVFKIMVWFQAEVDKNCLPIIIY